MSFSLDEALSSSITAWTADSVRRTSGADEPSRARLEVVGWTLSRRAQQRSARSSGGDYRGEDAQLRAHFVRQEKEREVLAPGCLATSKDRAVSFSKLGGRAVQCD